MSTDISICVLKEFATPAEFAEWEGISRGSVYQKIHHGKLAKYLVPKIKNKDHVRIRYLAYKADQVRESLGHSNFRIVVG
ncbi:Rha family transcriptional regulator [Cronobacter sakazakii]|uniref:Rha family transcriptional regulator n=1 Tax=Cronobacter TaxID=413496 RepID=UPI0009B84B7A|nr:MULTISPECIES: Rha family transcriptional regulator [Cronobacter]ELY4576259.1 Rha family transcriptional regulator [Cronobacter turicensis]EGT4399034.1 Rha family transcriptional regulator [Cronobacter malonaticus]EGT4415119.1 Rha family transcriptional regulator [Cronobacter malonaticus]EKK4083432.1 Rha family transcriptional regulator [Cronobacter dublinensis]ELY6327356.1 Rha family transcriptional regulator [Cronobacter malonaticus]